MNRDRKQAALLVGAVALLVVLVAAFLLDRGAAAAPSNSMPFPPDSYGTPTPVNLTPQAMPPLDSAGTPTGAATPTGTASPVPTQTQTQTALPGLPTVPPMATPRSPAPLPANALWAGDAGLGDLSQWSLGDGGGIFNSGTGSVTLANGITHNGHPALALTITNANGQEQAARIFRWGGNPEAAYYSVWLYFPQVYHPANWWNVFQFKSAGDVSNPLWVLNVGNTNDGKMRFYLFDAIHSKSYTKQLVEPTKTIPVACWTHVEAFYNRSMTNTGQLKIWQDGALIFNLDQVQTAISQYSQWGLANYTDNITPSTATIYAADAVISKTRMGPGEGPSCSQ